MDEDTTFLKVRDLVERAGLPEADVKRSLRNFSEFFTSRKLGRARLFTPDAVDRLKQIAELEAMGAPVPAIRGILQGGKALPSGREDPATATEEKAIASAGENLTLGVLADIKTLQLEAGELRAEIASLREKLGEHEQRIIGHQQQIRLLRHEMDEQKTESLARRMEERRTPFWKRVLFGRGGPGR